MKLSYLLNATFMLALATAAQAGTFYPNETENYDTETLRKIAFEGDDVVVEWDDQSTNRYEFCSLQRILFSEDKGEASEDEMNMAQQGFDIYLYPNPVIETLHLEGLPEGSDVLMYTAGGTTVAVFHSVGSSLEANIGNVKNGIYFLKIGKKVVKFVKQ